MDIKSKTTCRVPFGTISLTHNSRKLIDRALDFKLLTNGELVKKFEDGFAKKFDSPYAVAVSSGTDALTLALASLYDLGAERGDEVIIPALTFIATANAVVNAGFVPVFADIDSHTLNIDPTMIARAITTRTRAIVAVHLMGKPADMESILSIARQYNLNVIEDAAEAHGAEYHGQKVGTIAPIGCFSLYAAHIVTAIEGGMVTTKSDYIDGIVRSLRNHGLQLKGSDWTFDRIGYSSKMNEIEAAVGLGNLEIFDEIIEKRRRNFKYLLKGFQNPKLQHYFMLPEEMPYEKISPHAFPLVLTPDTPLNKEQFVWYLSSKGIDNRNLFYSIPTQTKSYAYLGFKYGCFPQAEYISNNGTHIGIHQDLELEQLDYVLETVKEFVAKHG